MSTLLALAGGLGGFILKGLNDSVKGLEKDLAAQAQKAAETYLRREDCHRQSDAVLDRLKGIEDKLDRVIERIGGKG